MSDRAPRETPAGHWVSYRPEIKVLDCTIRDGGLMNDHQFSDETVKAVYQACVEGGIDYMEIGYINSRRQFPPGQFGPWKHSAESDIRRIVGDNDTPLKLSAMADAEKSDYAEDILPKSESVLDLIRVATYIHQIPLALDMIRDAHDKGYETSLNLMALSTVPERELNEALALVARSEADVICIVDSFGALYCEQIDDYMTTFQGYATPAGKEVGMHAHNNRQLAFANTVQGDHQGRQPAGRQHGGAGPRSGQLPDGAAAELPAQPQVPVAAGAALHPAPHRAVARGAEVGLRLSVHDDRGAQSAPAGRDGVQRVGGPGRHHQVLRLARRPGLTVVGRRPIAGGRSRARPPPARPHEQLDMTLQDLVLTLSRFWSERGCLLQQPLDVEVGAGTMHPETFLRVIGPRHWNVAYVQPSRRPADGRFGENPNRLFKHHQFQVILKPSPDAAQRLYLDSLEACGIDPTRHDVRFEEDNWESPTLGAWGIGWQVLLDGLEITQFTYFQQAGGMDLAPISVELTYGLERIAMHLQERGQRLRTRLGARRHLQARCGIARKWSSRSTPSVRSICRPASSGISERRTAICSTATTSWAKRLLASGLTLPALDHCLKCSHTFNLLDASGSIGVTERAAYILRVRKLAVAIAEAHAEWERRQADQRLGPARRRRTQTEAHTVAGAGRPAAAKAGDA